MESLRLRTSALLVWFPSSGSVLDRDTWGEFSLMATFLILHHFSV